MTLSIQVIATLAIATLILFIFLKLFSTSSKAQKENNLDSKRKGKAILITGPISSGKTFLYQKLKNPLKSLKTAHSLKENVSHLKTWKLVDLPLDPQKLHSQPADFFHFNDLAALVLCLRTEDFEEANDFELVVIMSFAVGILKNVPFCISHLQPTNSINTDKLVDKLIIAFNNIQNIRLSSLFSSPDPTNTISFDDPINRLIFESSDGEIAADYQSKLRFYFDERVSFKGADEVSGWIDDMTL